MGNELYHHGVKGMRWGVLRSRTAVLYDKNPGRKAQYPNASSKNSYEGEQYNGPRSVKGNLHRIAAANHDLNAKTYRKLGNKNLAEMNEKARKESLQKAKAADKAKQAKQEAKIAKTEARRRYWEEQGEQAAIERKRSKQNGSISTKTKLNVASVGSKVNKLLEDQAKKNVSRTLAFQRKHKIGAYGKVSKAYHKARGHKV